ncbi:paired amphipathic helix protein Sin3b-like [Tigriopus californicus]|uniref:paired amphipathic helix protein Sin3b-like n=1 Tax=Tigriopus californicus TaxID=6832 RepID=UPI0027DA273D|nr:paired amphipathic helix protein Sin3b-like [Tigriopus californicus]XP_059085250.1 paired amphipathic helix protein Sin3b-like [Tigriopus californicus]XP_059085258.1 paired amphipathic helix protein Sin3b-like [Tigriopus californicus]XP_059085268.1 paired amphipathic helix protein Sin3b-like [Tigriopus californicus]XP_059085277.1 paired amphipathic helix protein Sin3b-like [Tigriopus californicus]
MKRVDEARVIKIAENSSVSTQPITIPNPAQVMAAAAAAAAASSSGGGPGAPPPSSGGGTSIFPTRPIPISISEMTSSAVTVGATSAPTSLSVPATVIQASSAANFTRVLHGPPGAGGASGVSVYRSTGDGSVAISPAPPVAHSTVAVTLPAQPSLQQHAVSMNPGLTQPASNIKPDIVLPSAPVSVQYATTSYSIQPVKSTTSNVQSAGVSAAHAIVSNLQHATQAHHPQFLHQKAPHPAGNYVNTLRALPANPMPNLTVATTLNAPVQITATSLPSSLASTNSTNHHAVSLTTSGNRGDSGNSQFQRLKVEDALSYLDQVKFKFGNQPQVYNDFLDIMKEFKSQSIDTPGVIARVSSLFKGHPQLIVGFNTFLPPGYKIEVQQRSESGIVVNLPGGIGHSGGSLQTIVHTPQGVHTMGPHGHMSVIPVTPSSAPGGANIRPVAMPAIQQSPVSQAVTTCPSQPGATTVVPKFNPIKSEVPQGLQLPQQPTPAHAQQANVTYVSGGAGPRPEPHILSQPNSHHPSHPGLPSTPVSGGPLPGSHPVLHNNSGLLNAQTASVANSQPVEFNHAINYVNKIKHRFHGQPDVYKQFLEILHTYQKDQKLIKEGGTPQGKYLTESEVYAQVSKLFHNQDDLLSEFGQFLPEATGESGQGGLLGGKSKKPGVKFGMSQPNQIPGPPGLKYSNGSNKRPPTGLAHPPPKKIKSGALRDVTLSEAGKYGTLNEYAFFDKVRKALRNPDVYENFLRCLVLFNQEVISRQEVVQLTSPFLGKHPDLFKWFKEFVGCKDGSSGNGGGLSGMDTSNNLSQPPMGRERMSGDSAMEIDYATCKRLGASYCAVPKNFIHPRCTGRTQLCKEVLNITWVSFPSFSEDSQFVTSRKTQFEEFIYRTEDERFEFDVVLETNRDTIKVLECVLKKMNRMPPEEAARYKLDDGLGGSSNTIHQRAIRRIYGDKAADIIEGLKRNPVVAVPLVLRRLKAKDEEWREVQKSFNKIWREQNEKYYLKSLDHQSLMFKQLDVRNLRSKSLLNEIETLYDERHEHEDNNGGVAVHGPHQSLDYFDKQIFADANNLLIHHVKRQTSIHKEDKQKIKTFLKHHLMDMFKHHRQDLSDDEKEDDDEDQDKDDHDESDRETSSGSKSSRSERARKKKEDEEKMNVSNTGGSNTSNKEASKSSKKDVKELTEADVKVEVPKDGRRTPLHARDMDADESYCHIMANNHWYLFFRLHNLLCERLFKMYKQALQIAAEEAKEKNVKQSTAVALRLKPKSEIHPKDYYPAFLDMVKNVLDGNMDSSAFEDTLREMFGIHAYVSFTLDKVVGNAVRQLQHLVTEESAVECYDMFLSESKANATGGLCRDAHQRQLSELFYQKKAEKLLVEENCVKVFIYHKKLKITFELLDTESESQNSEQDEESSRKWHLYVEKFIQPGDEISNDCKERLRKKPVFLPRGIRSYSRTPNGRKEIQRSQNYAQKLGSGKKSKGMEDDKSGSDLGGNESETKENDAEKESRVGGGAAVGVAASSSSSRLSDNGITHVDNTQCKFNPKTFKRLYVINSDSWFYRKLALKRAKQTHKKVSRRKTEDFNRWHLSWVADHVSASQQTRVSDWFMGHIDGLVPNTTHKEVKNYLERTPYRVFHKYHAEVTATPSGIPAESSTAASGALGSGSSCAADLSTGSRGSTNPGGNGSKPGGTGKN